MNVCCTYEAGRCVVSPDLRYRYVLRVSYRIVRPKVVYHEIKSTRGLELVVRQFVLLLLLLLSYPGPAVSGMICVGVFASLSVPVIQPVILLFNAKL